MINVRDNGGGRDGGKGKRVRDRDKYERERSESRMKEMKSINYNCQ